MNPIFRKSLAVLLSLILAVSVFAGCGDTVKPNTDGASVGITDTVSGLAAIFPVNETVEMHTEKQEKFLNGKYRSAYLYANGTKEKAVPNLSGSNGHTGKRKTG